MISFGDYAYGHFIAQFVSTTHFSTFKEWEFTI